MTRAVRALAVVTCIMCGLGGASCSVFTSLDGLQGGDDSLDAALADGNADVTAPDGATHDAQTDAAADGGSAYVAAVLADHPVAYWRLGEASTASLMTDQTGANTGAYDTGAALGAPGALVNDPDTAVICNGHDPIGSAVGTSLDFDGLAPMSIELWAMPTLSDGNPRFMVTKEIGSDSSREGWSALFEETKVNIERIRDGQFDDIGTGVVALDVYSHVVLTFDGTTATTYLNGAASGSVGFTESMTSTTSSVVLGFGGATGFVGSLDEVALYDYALGADRVLAHYKVGRGL